MTAFIPLSITVHTRNPNMVDDLCHASMECGGPPETSYLHLAVATLLLVVFVVAATIIHLRSAKHAVSEERSRTALEREAFADFTRRVAAIDAESAPTQSITSTGPLTLATKSQPNAQLSTQHLDEVTDAYRDTVMALPHYEEDYNEPLTVNLAAELGEDVSSAIVSGAQFTPQLKQAIILQARDSFRQRSELLNQIHLESDELDAAVDRLAAVDDALCRFDEQSLSDREFDELRDIWAELGEYEDECTGLLADRQHHITDRTSSSPEFYEYLYQSLPVTHPILDDTLRLIERVRSARRVVLRALTQRV